MSFKKTDWYILLDNVAMTNCNTSASGESCVFNTTPKEALLASTYGINDNNVVINNGWVYSISASLNRMWTKSDISVWLKIFVNWIDILASWTIWFISGKKWHFKSNSNISVIKKLSSWDIVEIKSYKNWNAWVVSAIAWWSAFTLIKLI